MVTFKESPSALAAAQGLNGKEVRPHPLLLHPLYLSCVV